MKDASPVLRISRIAIFICLLVIMAYPIFWSVMSSVKTNAELVANPFSIPRKPQIDNIIELWVEGDFIRYFRNTLIISLVTVFGVVTMATMAGYVFSQRQSGLYKFLFLLFLFGLMVPREVVIVPVFRIIASLGLRNTLAGVILVYLAGTSFGIVLMRTYFLTVPSELREAALIDGCSEFGVFLRGLRALGGACHGHCVDIRLLLQLERFALAAHFDPKSRSGSRWCKVCLDTRTNLPLIGPSEAPDWSSQFCRR